MAMPGGVRKYSGNIYCVAARHSFNNDALGTWSYVRTPGFDDDSFVALFHSALRSSRFDHGLMFRRRPTSFVLSE
jgi:hypothetical protein